MTSLELAQVKYEGGWVNVQLKRDVFYSLCRVGEKVFLSSPSDLTRFLIQSYRKNLEPDQDLEDEEPSCSECGGPISLVCSSCLANQHNGDELSAKTEAASRQPSTENGPGTAETSSHARQNKATNSSVLEPRQHRKNSSPKTAPENNSNSKRVSKTTPKNTSNSQIRGSKTFKRTDGFKLEFENSGGFRDSDGGDFGSDFHDDDGVDLENDFHYGDDDDGGDDDAEILGFDDDDDSASFSASKEPQNFSFSPQNPQPLNTETFGLSEIEKDEDERQARGMGIRQCRVVLERLPDVEEKGVQKTRKRVPTLGNQGKRIYKKRRARCPGRPFGFDMNLVHADEAGSLHWGNVLTLTLEEREYLDKIKVEVGRKNIKNEMDVNSEINAGSSSKVVGRKNEEEKIGGTDDGIDNEKSSVSSKADRGRQNKEAFSNSQQGEDMFDQETAGMSIDSEPQVYFDDEKPRSEDLGLNVFDQKGHNFMGRTTKYDEYLDEGNGQLTSLEVPSLEASRKKIGAEDLDLNVLDQKGPYFTGYTKTEERVTEENQQNSSLEASGKKIVDDTIASVEGMGIQSDENLVGVSSQIQTNVGRRMKKQEANKVDTGLRRPRPAVVDDFAVPEIPKFLSWKQGRACKVCGKVFHRSQCMRRHLLVHTGVKNHECKVCGKLMATPLSLKNHTRLHTGAKPFVCDVCNKAFAYPAALYIHMQNHNGQKPFRCELCGIHYINEDLLEKHRLRSHFNPDGTPKKRKLGKKKKKKPKDEQKKPKEKKVYRKPVYGLYPCTLCKCTMKTDTAFEKHMERSHRGGEGFKCDFCPKFFPNKSEFDRHTRRHTLEKAHLCDICGKACIDVSALKSHRKVHSDLRPYKCPHCDKFFKFEAGLRAHSWRHKQEKPYACDICGKRYAARDKLKTHKYSHTGERPHVCQKCGKSFTEKCRLQDHDLTHTQIKNHVCVLCGRAFGRKNHLRTHYKLIHRKKFDAVTDID